MLLARRAFVHRLKFARLEKPCPQGEEGGAEKRLRSVLRASRMRPVKTIPALPAILLLAVSPVLAAPPPRPAMADFMGVCGHTVQFKPELYRQVCRLARDYHPVEWDLGKDSDFVTTFPFARNRVNWEHVYGAWRKQGFDINTSLMFESLKQPQWKDVPRDAFVYGKAFARYCGPSGHKLVDAVEIGNEPGGWDDAAYRAMFENMAKGLRAGDPRLRIATCAANAGKSEKYSKALTCVQGLEPLYDIITVHSYAMLENWPTWRRGCPEDPKLLDYLPRVRAVCDWRDAHAPGKAVWLTEFGYDATTKLPPKTGDFKKWVGVTDVQQAQWLVRSFLVFSSLPVDRAYVYFFNDRDEPQLHGSSGLTRNFQPKPAFHAVAHLQRSLGAYRFARAVLQQPDRYLFEYQHATNAKQRVWVVWSPTAGERQERCALPDLPGKLFKAERMPLTADAKLTVTDGEVRGTTATVTVSESPLYLWLQLP
jgi:serine/threonine-protein kinase ATR